jgi:hypothetical protein
MGKCVKVALKKVGCDMTFDEMVKAVNEAEWTQRTAERQVAKMTGLIAGKLQTADVPQYVLVKLKKELESYNMRTGRWK